MMEVVYALVIVISLLLGVLAAADLGIVVLVIVPVMIVTLIITVGIEKVLNITGLVIGVGSMYLLVVPNAYGAMMMPVAIILMVFCFGMAKILKNQKEILEQLKGKENIQEKAKGIIKKAQQDTCDQYGNKK